MKPGKDGKVQKNILNSSKIENYAYIIYMEQPIIGMDTGEDNLLSHIFTIYKVLKDNGIENLKDDSPDVQILVEKLHISSVQAVLFSIVLIIQDDQSASIGDIAKKFKIPSIMILKYKDDFNVLVEKRLFRVFQGYPGRSSPFGSNGDNSTTTYRVPKNVIDVLNRNEEYIPPTLKNLSFEEFIGTMDDLFEQRTSEFISNETLKYELFNLIKENPDLDFVKTIKDFNLSEDDLMLLLLFCNQEVDDNQRIYYQTISAIFTPRSRTVRIWKKIINENTKLQELEIIECSFYEGLGDDKSFCLTQKAKEILLGEISTKNIIGKKPKGWISWKDIKPKELIYNASENEMVSKLQILLDKDHFNDVCNRLQTINMRTGFPCIFSGSPGTGKTETALQIARLTQRDIVKVDISTAKTKWFGESEKCVKEIFERYRGLVKSARSNGENIPILFFNEADGIFSKRTVINTERSSPAQTENAIQNIILDELENLDGILIATTNLTVNMDDAFERRFLYKIEFSKPDKDSRKTIWKSMIEGLSDNDSIILADTFQFSGGQIENISRKRTIDIVITGRTPNLEEMISMCRDEKLIKDTSCKIGFNVEGGKYESNSH